MSAELYTAAIKHSMRKMTIKALAVPLAFAGFEAALLVALLIACPDAHAQQAQASTDADTNRVAILGDLDIHQSNEMVYKSKAAEAKAKADFDKYADGQGDHSSTGNAGAAVDVESELPTYTDVFGGTQGNRAEFLYPNRTTATGGKGEKISGGYTVVEVSLNDVAISKNGKVYHLSRGTAAAVPHPQQINQVGIPVGVPGGFVAPPGAPGN